MTDARFLPAFLLCVVGPLHATAAHHDGAKAAKPEAPPSSISVPLDAGARARLAREPVIATAHGQSLRCKGVSPTAFLRASKTMPAGPLRCHQLACHVLVTARDGYRAVFSLAELDPLLGNHNVLLVDRCDGKPLDNEGGPLRLIAPAESRPARWVRQIESISVVTAP